MARFDRKRWWEPKPTPPQPKYYGIVVDMYVVDYLFKPLRPVVKPVYKVVPYHRFHQYYIKQRFTEAEAEAICKILNAGGMNEGGS